MCLQQEDCHSLIITREVMIMRRKITFLLTFLVAVLSIIMAGGRVYADTGYEVEDMTNTGFLLC